MPEYKPGDKVRRTGQEQPEDGRFGEVYLSRLLQGTRRWKVKRTPSGPELKYEWSEYSFELAQPSVDKLQFLVDWCDRQGHLPNHAFTFPDGETVNATDPEVTITLPRSVVEQYAKESVHLPEIHLATVQAIQVACIKALD